MNNEKSKNEESNDIIEENTVKKNSFTGLSAILSGQAAPGTLPHHTAQPAKPVVLSIQAMPTASAGQTAAFQKTTGTQLDNGCIGYAAPTEREPAQPRA